MLRGDRLKRLRNQHELTHEEIAEALGVSVSQIWRYEAEKVDPSTEVLSRMAKLFHVTTDYLVGLTDDATPPIEGDLSEKEKRVVAALRHGEPMLAIKAIVDDE